MSKRENRREIYQIIDVPFNLRNTCFYCGEISTELDHVPPTSRYSDFMGMHDSHVPLLIPSCVDCNSLLHNSLQRSVWERFDFCKSKLVVSLRVELAIGENWTKEELDASELSGNILGGFKKSGMNVYDRALARVKWVGWPVMIDGDEIALKSFKGYRYKNIDFPSYSHLTDYLRRSKKISIIQFDEIIEVVGINNIDYAIKICETVKCKTRKELDEMLLDLQELM